MSMRMLPMPVILLACLGGCSRTQTDDAPLNEAPALTQAARPSGGDVAQDDKPRLPDAAMAAPPVRDLPGEAAVADTPAADMPFPAEVTDFMVMRDGCDHFRGEEAYDAERGAYLQENIRQLCTGTDAKLAELRRRYRSDRDVIAALQGYEDEIETSPPEESDGPLQVSPANP